MPNCRSSVCAATSCRTLSEQGCKWQGLPKRFGRWHTIYSMNRWAKNGVLDRVFEQLQMEQIVRINKTRLNLRKREVVWNLLDQIDAEVNQILPLPIAEARKERNMSFGWIRIAVAEELALVWIVALQAGFDIWRFIPRQRALLLTQ